MAVPCTDEAHFAVTIEDLQTPMQELIHTYPLPVTGTDTYSHNTVYSDETTWFSSTDTYYIEAEDTYAYVDFDYDTATGQLHQIYLSVPGRGSAADMTKQFLLMLNDADAWDSEQNQRSDAADLDELYDRMMDFSVTQTEGSGVEPASMQNFRVRRMKTAMCGFIRTEAATATAMEKIPTVCKEKQKHCVPVRNTTDMKS